MCLDSCWSPAASAVCILSFLLTTSLTTAIKRQKKVTIHPLILLFLPSPNQHPATADITAQLIIRLDIGCLSLYAEVITFATRQCQTDRSHFTPEEGSNPWQQRLRPKVSILYLLLLSLETLCGLNYNHPRHVFSQQWMTLLKLTRVGQDIPWLQRLSISCLNWLPWGWPTPKPLARSLFCLGALQCEPPSSPLFCAAKPA